MYSSLENIFWRLTHNLPNKFMTFYFKGFGNFENHKKWKSPERKVQSTLYMLNESFSSTVVITVLALDPVVFSFFLDWRAGHHFGFCGGTVEFANFGLVGAGHRGRSLRRGRRVRHRWRTTRTVPIPIAINLPSITILVNGNVYYVGLFEFSVDSSSLCFLLFYETVIFSETVKIEITSIKINFKKSSLTFE